MIKGLLIVAAAGVLAGAPALAAAPEDGLRVSQGASGRADLAAFAGGPDTLPRAIRAVESATGGRVVEARFAANDGAPGFRFVVLKNGEVSFLRAGVDGSGEAVITDASLPRWMLSWRQRRELKIEARAPRSLTDAIIAAEQSTHAPAVAAGISRTAVDSLNAVKAYNVLVAEDGRPHRVAIDARTGQVIQNPGALNWP